MLWIIILHVIVFTLGSCAFILETLVATVQQELWDYAANSNLTTHSRVNCSERKDTLTTYM